MCWCNTYLAALVPVCLSRFIIWNCLFVSFCVVFTKPPYEVRETGWGEFEIQIKIYFQDSSEKPVSGGYG